MLDKVELRAFCGPDGRAFPSFDGWPVFPQAWGHRSGSMDGECMFLASVGEDTNDCLFFPARFFPLFVRKGWRP